MQLARAKGNAQTSLIRESHSLGPLFLGLGIFPVYELM